MKTKRLLKAIFVIFMVICATVTVYAVSETEPNNGTNTATEIVLGTECSGNICSSEDVDWYKFTVEKDYFTLSFIVDNSVDKSKLEEGWTLTIYDTSATKVIKEYDIDSSLTTPVLPYSGEFYVCINSYSKYYAPIGCKYTLLVNETEDLQWEDEKDDSLTTAKSILINKEYFGVLNDSDDVDCFSFTTDKDYFTVEFNYDPSETYATDVENGWNVSILYSDGTTVLKEYDVKGTLETPVLPYSGTFYICIKPESSYYSPTDCYYSVRVNTTTDPSWEKEKNDITSKATSISVNERYIGSIDNTTDIDIYKFTTDKDYFTFSFNYDPRETYATDVENGWNVSILYSDGTTVLKEYDIKGMLETPILPYSGTFYICIKPQSRYYSPTDCYYSIRVNTTTDPSWEKESNETTGKATKISFNKVYNGITSAEDDIDYFKFSSANGLISVSFSTNTVTDKSAIENGWDIAVLDDNGNQIDEWTSTTNFNKSVLVKGSGYICIKPESRYYAPVDCHYNLKVSNAEHNWKTIKTKATTSKNGSIDTKCVICGAVKSSITIYKVSKISLSYNTTTYTGKALKPTVKVKDSSGKVVDSKYYTVSYNSNTNVGKSTVKITLKGNYSGTKTLNFTIAPKQVTGLKSSDEKTTSLKLSWSKATGAKHYRVEQSTDGKKWKTVYTTDKTSYTVKSLKAGTKYQFRVTALDSTKKIAGKPSAVLKTATLTGAPSVTLKSSKYKTATASWKKVTGASKYVVYKSIDGKKWTKVTTTANTSCTLSKLTGGKKIYVKVSAINAYGKASASSIIKNVTVKK